MEVEKTIKIERGFGFKYTAKILAFIVTTKSEGLLYKVPTVINIIIQT